MTAFSDKPVIIGGDPKTERTSVVQGAPHDDSHKLVLYDMYQVFIVCQDCGAHDWGEEAWFDKDGREPSRADFEKKYGDRIVRVVDMSYEDDEAIVPDGGRPRGEQPADDEHLSNRRGEPHA